MRGLGKIATHAVLLAWGAICLFPIYWLVITSIKGLSDIDKPPGYLPFVDFFPSLESWRFILFDQNESLVTRFVNSTAIGGISTILTLAAGGMAVYGLTRFPGKFRWLTLGGCGLATACALVAALVPDFVLRAILIAGALASLVLAFGLSQRGPVVGTFGALAVMLSTRVLPPIVIVLPLYTMAEASGLRDTLTFMIFVYAAVNLPVAVWLLQPVLGPRATEQEEAAQLDGASHLRILFTILIPMVRVGFAAAGLLVFLLCWNEYLFAAFLTSDHALTLPPWMVGQLSMKEAQVGGGAEELGHLSAATVLMIAPALALSAFIHKSLSRTFTPGK